MFGYEYEITKESPADFLDLEPTRTKEILAEMLTDGIIAPKGRNKNHSYWLKSQLDTMYQHKNRQLDPISYFVKTGGLRPNCSTYLLMQISYKTLVHNIVNVK